MRFILHLTGAILFLNYRLFYVFAVRKTLYGYKEFLIQKETDKTIATILTLDIAFLGVYFLNIWTLLLILTIISIINLIVYLIWKKKK